MVDRNLISYMNTVLDRVAGKLHVDARDAAPMGWEELVKQGHSTIVWAGASEGTVWGPGSSNHRVRVWHDGLHLKYGLDFSTPSEMVLGRIQAGMLGQWSDVAGDIMWADSAGQTLYCEETGEFPTDQLNFVLKYFSK